MDTHVRQALEKLSGAIDIRQRSSFCQFQRQLGVRVLGKGMTDRGKQSHVRMAIVRWSVGAGHLLGTDVHGDRDIQSNSAPG